MSFIYQKVGMFSWLPITLVNEGRELWPIHTNNCMFVLSCVIWAIKRCNLWLLQMQHTEVRASPLPPHLLRHRSISTSLSTVGSRQRLLSSSDDLPGVGSELTLSMESLDGEMQRRPSPPPSEGGMTFPYVIFLSLVLLSTIIENY